MSSSLLTIGDAAIEIGVSTRTIRRYLSTGRLPGYRVAGQHLIRVKRADLEALLVRIPSASTQ